MQGRTADQGADLPTFVARIWLEPGPGATKSWRGRVQHVQGDREAYFQSIEELRAFLEEVSGVPGPALQGGGETGSDERR